MTEPAPAPQPATQPTVQPDPAAGGEPRNVSAEQFKGLSDQVTGLAGMVEKLLSAQQPTKPAESAKPAESTTTEPTAQSQEINDLKAQVAALTASQSQANLSQVVADEAKAAEVDVTGMESFLIGKDAETTKANVQAFAKSIKAHDDTLLQQNKQSTDPGFNPQANNIGKTSAGDFMKDLLAGQFGTTATAK